LIFYCRDRDFDAELETHLQLHIDDNIRRGLSPDEAGRAALVKLGGVQALMTAMPVKSGAASSVRAA
jgi:hypothetical protein